MARAFAPKVGNVAGAERLDSALAVSTSLSIRLISGFQSPGTLLDFALLVLLDVL